MWRRNLSIRRMDRGSPTWTAHWKGSAQSTWGPAVPEAVYTWVLRFILGSFDSLVIEPFSDIPSCPVILVVELKYVNCHSLYFQLPSEDSPLLLALLFAGAFQVHLAGGARDTDRNQWKCPPPHTHTHTSWLAQDNPIRSLEIGTLQSGIKELHNKWRACLGL